MGKPFCPTLDGSPKGEASVALLMRSAQMASQKQLHFFLSQNMYDESKWTLSYIS
jgi:hypothetical protein